MIKYKLEIDNINDEPIRIEIDHPDYTGDVIELIGSDNPIKIEWSGNDNDDRNRKHVIPSTVTIGFYSTGVDIDELLDINDASMSCRVYYNDSLFWQGYIISDGIESFDSAIDYPLTVKAIDGLELLDNIDFTWSNNYPSITVNGVDSHLRCPMNAIRNILYGSSNLNNKLPIRWNTSISRNDSPNSDFLAGKTALNSDGKLSQYTGGKSGMWWLENIAKSAYSWVFQYGGCWYISSYIDIYNNNGVFNGFEISTNTTTKETATNISESFLTSDIEDRFINTDPRISSRKPLSKVSVSYSPVTDSNNALPNGSFDMVSTGTVMDWYSVLGAASISSNNPISVDGNGYSAMVRNWTTKDDAITTGLMPINSKDLYKNCNIGFKWLPMSGFSVDSNGYLDPNQKPVYFKLRYDVNNTSYYLNEFGYWSNNSGGANQSVLKTEYMNTQNWFLVYFKQDVDFFAGDQVNITIKRIGSGLPESYSITFNTTMDFHSGMEYIQSHIPNSSVGNSSVAARPLTIYNVENSPIFNRANVVKDDQYYQKVFIDIPSNLKQGVDALNIEFQSKGNANGVKIPEGIGYLYFEIGSKKQTEIILDDAYVTFNNVIDKFTAKTSGINSGEDYDMSISSNENGFNYSNYMTKYTNSLNECGFNGYSTLTEFYAETTLRTKIKPQRILSAEVDGLVRATDMIDYEGRLFFPLSISFDMLVMSSNVVHQSIHISDDDIISIDRVNGEA